MSGGLYYHVDLSQSHAYNMKNNCSLFDRLFKKKNNDSFLFGTSFFVLEILTFFYYAN